MLQKARYERNRAQNGFNRCLQQIYIDYIFISSRME